MSGQRLTSRQLLMLWTAPPPAQSLGRGAIAHEGRDKTIEQIHKKIADKEIEGGAVAQSERLRHEGQERNRDQRPILITAIVPMPAAVRAAGCSSKEYTRAQTVQLDWDQRARPCKPYSYCTETGLSAWEDSMANVAPQNNRLMPWYVGIAIVLAAVIFFGYQMWATSCPAPTIIQIGVLTVIPLVYLALMYLTFVSQK
jgi:hypothetical protein